MVLKKKRKPLQKFENIIMFPGAIETLLSQAHSYAENYQYDLANTAFEEALKYSEGDELTLSVYAYSLYEAKNFEKAKEICERLLAIGPSMYFEVMELYLTISMQLRQFKQVEKIIDSLIEEDAIPIDRLEKFERLRKLNAEIAENKQQLEEPVLSEQELDEEDFSLEQFLKQSPNEQLMLVHDLTITNIRPIAQSLKQVIEHNETHPFIKSLLLILLVEQEVAMDVTIHKFGVTQRVNPAQLQLPTRLPHFQNVSAIIGEELEQEPSKLELVQYLIAKHSIVTYPFEWLQYEDKDVATGYMNYVNTMFGEVQEKDDEIISFLQEVEKLTELQRM